MKIETQPLEDHQVKLKVEVEPEAMEEAKQKAARKLSRQVKIPGFRPGKAPYAVIARQIGEGAITEEALELLIKDLYPKIIDEAGIEPYGPGSLENVVSMEPPVLEFVVPLEAEIELGDYRSITKTYDPPEVTEEQVEKTLNELQEQQAVLEPVERAVQPGDMAYVRISAERIQPEEGQDLALIRERSMPFRVRGPEDEGEKYEWPFPGFSDYLIGMEPKSEKTFEYTFSEDSEFESLRGASATFHLVLEDVKSRILPELNDEFAKSLGEFDTLDEVRALVRESLERQSADEYNQEYENALIEQGVELSTIKYPPQMLENEINNVIHNLEHRLEDQQLEMDLYLKSRNMTMDQLREEARPAAEDRIKRTLFLSNLAEAEEIKVGNEELQSETIRTLENLSQNMSEKDARKLNNRETINALLTNVMGDLVLRKAVSRLRSIASGIPEEELKEAEAEEAAEEVIEATPMEEQPSNEEGVDEQPAVESQDRMIETTADKPESED